MAIRATLAAAAGAMGGGGRTAAAYARERGARGTVYAAGRGFEQKTSTVAAKALNSKPVQRMEDRVLRAQTSKPAEWSRKLSPQPQTSAGGSRSGGGGKRTKGQGVEGMFGESNNPGYARPGSGRDEREQLMSALGHKTTGIGRLGSQVRGSQAWLGAGPVSDLLGHGIQSGVADVSPNWRSDARVLARTMAGRAQARQNPPPSTELVHVPNAYPGLPSGEARPMGRGERPGNPIPMAQGSAPGRPIDTTARRIVTPAAPLELTQGTKPKNRREAGAGASQHALGNWRRGMPPRP